MSKMSRAAAWYDDNIADVSVIGPVDQIERMIRDLGDEVPTAGRTGLANRSPSEIDFYKLGRAAGEFAAAFSLAVDISGGESLAAGEPEDAFELLCWLLGWLDGWREVMTRRPCPTDGCRGTARQVQSWTEPRPMYWTCDHGHIMRDCDGSPYVLSDQ